jgi:hypothetical protein
MRPSTCDCTKTLSLGTVTGGGRERARWPRPLGEIVEHANNTLIYYW